MLKLTYVDKDKDNNWLGLSASLLAGEIAFRGYFSKDTTPLGPEAAADPSTFIVPWRRSSPTGKVQVQRSQSYYYSLTGKRIRPCRWSLIVLFENAKDNSTRKELGNKV